MKLKDIKIATQLTLGFCILLIFVILLGVISHLQTDKIHQQTEIMYNHPLIVRRVLDKLTSDVLNIRMSAKDLIYAVTDKERQDANQLIALTTADVLKQFDILRKAYLGPHKDVEGAFHAFERWSMAHERYRESVLANQIQAENPGDPPSGELTVLREQLTASIKVIDDFAKNKSDELYIAANKLNHSLTFQLILLVTIILLLSLITIYILVRNIRNPLTELTLATQRFQDGDMSARSAYESKNEFGVLSASFNILAENIQKYSDKLAYQNRELEFQKIELQVLSAKLLSAEEMERKRIANDIHDSIGQALSAIKFGIENSLVSISEDSPLAAIETLSSIIPLIQKSIDEVRRIIMDLRPSTLDDLGLLATINWFCREFEAIYTNIHIDKEIDVKETDIPSSLKTVIYRILQEAFSNAAKHSQTDSIRLHLAGNKDNLELMIEDTGVGFAMDQVLTMHADKKGIGLTSMKERALQSGGTFKVKSSPGAGTSLFVSWPKKQVV